MNCMAICPGGSLRYWPGLPRILEIYSIDESFLNLSGVESPLLLSQRIRKTVGRWTGIPISIGLGKTKTLAKLANRLAKKKKTGCFEVSAGQDDVLSGIPIEDIWGVGRRLSIRLQRVGLTNALSFSRAPSSMIRSIGGVTLESVLNVNFREFPAWKWSRFPNPVKTPVPPAPLAGRLKACPN